MGVLVCVCGGGRGIFYFLFFFNLHFTALLKALVYMILRYNYNAMPMDVLNVAVLFGKYV